MNISLKDTVAQKPLFSILFLCLVSTAMHWQIFTTDLIGVHVWRQSQTQINIQNFVRYDFNIMNPRNNFVFGESNIKRFEFPVMQWLIASADKVFGESITVTRISMFLIGIACVIGMFFLLKAVLKDNLTALLGAWAFNFSPLFYYYTMNPLPDVFALCCTVWYMFFLFSYFDKQKTISLLLAAFFLGLATLAKLPFIIFGSVAAVYVLQQLQSKGIAPLRKCFALIFVFTSFLLPAFFWYKWVIPSWGDNGVLKGIFSNSVSTERTIEIFKFHAFELLPKILLNYAVVPFFLAGCFFMVKNKVYVKAKWSLLAAAGLTVILYFLLEYNMIDIIHDYYMLPFLPPLFLIVAYGIKMLLMVSRFTRFATVGLLILLPFFAFLAVNNYWNVRKSYFNPDVFIYRKELKKAVPTDSKCIILNDVSGYIFSYQVDKQGAIFNDENLSAAWIRDLVKKGYRYMYSDCRNVDDNPEVQKSIDHLMVECGSVKVFKLKEE